MKSKPLLSVRRIVILSYGVVCCPRIHIYKAATQIHKICVNPHNKGHYLAKNLDFRFELSFIIEYERCQL